MYRPNIFEMINFDIIQRFVTPKQCYNRCQINIKTKRSRPLKGAIPLKYIYMFD